MPDEFIVLPANPYAKYALPIEYLPSRDLRPRWGNTRPPIASLHEWFRDHAPAYHAFLDEMARALPGLASIPRDFREEQLPEPAWFGVPFAPFDALALYTMVRLRRPHTYIEVGSGISTCIVAKSVRDHALDTRIISIDPEPRAAIDSICDEIVRDGLETCDLARFENLRPGDILFFDGSHRSFMNSDVTVFFIDIVPRLRPGVIVHVHDVTLPWDYPDMFINWYWNEQYILAAYMIAARERLDPILPTAFICRDEQFSGRLTQPFIDFGDPDLNFGWRGGGSMWFTHKGEPPIIGVATPEEMVREPVGRGRARRPDASLAERIREICDLPDAEIAAVGFERLTPEIADILRDPLFASWPIDQQQPMIRRVQAIYLTHYDASGRKLIPALEALFRRTVATPRVSIEVLWLYHDLMYFLYWYSACDWEAMRGVGATMRLFAAAIRAGSASGLPAITPRPLGREPLRLGYLAQFVLLGNAVARGVGDMVDGLARHMPGTYHLFLYAWAAHDHDDVLLAPLADAGVVVRCITASSLSEHIAAVAEAIAADEIDILITDMNTALPATLFERRVAPVQIFFQTGLPYWPLANIDGVLRVEFYDPRLDDFDPEMCFDLGLGAWNQRIWDYAPPVEPARIAAERARFPPAGRLIGNYGRLAVITPDFLEIINALLVRHPQLVVVLGGTGDGRWIHDFIAARGLAGRLVLIDELVDGHVWGRMLDFFLDTSYGVTTAGREVMAKGKPIVCMRNPATEHERVPMLIADDPQQYLGIASRLLDDPAFYQAACAATNDFVANQPDEREFVAAIHDALTSIVRRVRDR